jgi:hypothetical protein
VDFLDCGTSVYPKKSELAEYQIESAVGKWQAERVAANSVGMGKRPGIDGQDVLAAIQSRDLAARSAEQLIGYRPKATGQIKDLPPLPDADFPQNPCPCRREPLGLLTKNLG